MAQKLQRRSHPEAILSGATRPSSSRRRSTRGPDAGATPSGRSGMSADVTALARKDRVKTPSDVGVIVEAQHLGLGQRLSQARAVALGQAAGGDHLRA